MTFVLSAHMQVILSPEKFWLQRKPFIGGKTSNIAAQDKQELLAGIQKETLPAFPIATYSKNSPRRQGFWVRKSCHYDMHGCQQFDLI